jgi:neurofibromin 1
LLRLTLADSLAGHSIGGFIFLRFINPAIVSPETIDLDLPVHGSAGDNRDIRRGLVMITKVLQALANNVRFGSKEPGMKKLNEFMDVQVVSLSVLFVR